MKKSLFVAALFFLVSGAIAQTGAPAPVQVRKRPASDASKSALPPAVSGLKKKHGQAMADLKKKQRQEMLLLKEKLAASPGQETLRLIEEKKRQFRLEVESLKSAQRQEMRLLKKNMPEPAKEVKK